MLVPRNNISSTKAPAAISTEAEVRPDTCNKPKVRRFDSQWSLWSFHRLNPSGRNVVQGSSPLLTEMSKRNISMGKRRPVLRANNLATF